MEFNMLKLSQKLKLLDQLNKTTWISLRFTPLDYSFYILQLLNIFCHFVHPKCPWHFTPLEYFDILHPRSIFDFGVLKSYLVGSGSAKMRSGPYLTTLKSQTSIANQLPIALFVSLALFVQWDRIVQWVRIVNCVAYKRLSKVALKWKLYLLLSGN